MQTLRSNQNDDHAIKLQTGKIFLFGLLHNFSEHQLEDLYEYIDENFANRFITFLKFLAIVLVLFTP